jgi:hypothetical protein
VTKQIPPNYARVFYWYYNNGLSTFLLFYDTDNQFPLVLNPIDPTTGLEVGASQRGKKRERSGSATLDQVSEASSSKKVAMEKTTPNLDPNCYTFKAFAVWKLINIIKLAKWAKHHFRFILITEPPGYLTSEEKIALSTTSYQISKTTHANFQPEIGNSFLTA